MVEVEAKKWQRGLGDNCCVIVKSVLESPKSMHSFEKFWPLQSFLEDDFELIIT